MEICFEENVMYCIILAFVICSTYRFIISISKKSSFDKFINAISDAEVIRRKLNETEDADESNN